MSNQTNTNSSRGAAPVIRPDGRRGGGPGALLTVEKAKDKKHTLIRLIKYFGREKIMLICLLVSVMIGVVCSVFAPSLQSKGIDKITIREFDALPKILIVMLIVYGIASLCSMLQALLSAHLSQRIVKKLREDLFHKIVNFPVKYMDSHPHGDIMSRMTNDVENISNTVSQSLCSMVSGVLTILGTVAMMIWYCWQLALLSCITVILTVFATKYLAKAMKKFFRKRQALLGDLNTTVEEMVTGYKTVVAYNRQDEAIEEFNKTSDELTKTGIKAEILGGSMGPVMNGINNISFVIIAAFGGYFTLKGMISVGVISAFIVYAKQFGRPINEIAQLYGQIETALAGAERVFAVMDEEVEDKSGDKTMDDAQGVITFRNVNFSYTPEKQVLFDFNLEVPAGHKIALVGATGSGKTTVVNLLMRFYDIDSGEILIDGVNIKEINCDNLRKNTAIVLQDTILFSDTIRNNLKYSNPEASDEEMEVAARMSNCDSMIRHMIEGYDTMLTESGSNLSQGQRQLLSIGRAFLASPKILILDEATSSVDTRTEKKIQDAMVNLMKNRTSLIIAHRLSTIQDADKIVVLDAGRIVEQGNHEELLGKKGKYYQLYMTQFAGNQT
ncbi:MAG: ABC transporter ATP-binding protein [Lachnospiraceae bacterium]|nr:ABC transporter ATP-binding protein [Lachnospiraceae bacterium]